MPELKAPIYGTKAELFKRLVKAEHDAAREIELQAMMEARAARRRAGEQFVPELLPSPSAPTETQRAEHEKHHCPPEPWCEFCQLGKAKDRPHRARTAEDVQRPRPELQFDWTYLQSSQPGDCEESLSTTLHGVDNDSGTHLHHRPVQEG